jgi:uncharacterized ubiquitin-like protein YukD
MNYEVREDFIEIVADTDDIFFRTYPRRIIPYLVKAKVLEGESRLIML